jgi:protein-histidine pros-kinase
MRLLTKLNLILLVLFGAAGLAISQIADGFLFKNARREVLQQAELMMASARSVRDYTSADLAPLLQQNPQHKERFLAETVPAYGAITTFEKLRKHYPEYSYNEATLNPTNPAHRAADWEADIIRYFRDHPEQKELIGDRLAGTGASLYLAAPLAADTSCMECHSRPSVAPPAMISTYGPNNGFGWKPGTVIAAQIVSVPTSVAVQNATEAFHLLLIYLIATLITTMVVLDLAIYFTVISPLKLVSDAADRASKGEVSPNALPVRGKDEIATMTASFNRMQVSLAKALKLLG